MCRLCHKGKNLCFRGGHCGQAACNSYMKEITLLVLGFLKVGGGHC